MMLIYLLFFTLAALNNLQSQDMLSEEKSSYRPPTAAGSFYSNSRSELLSSINEYLNKEKPIISKEEEIIGIVVPHAGYVYSGWVAGFAYREIIGRKYDAIVLIGPSHITHFRGASIFDGDAYTSPLGASLIDKKLAGMIAENSESINISRKGHGWNGGRAEHSLEVQIPFLQVVQPNVPIVPIIIGSSNFESADELMLSLVKAIKESNKKVLLIASTDLSHFHNQEKACAIDQSLIEDFKKFDYFKLAKDLASSKKEACGSSALLTVMMAAEQLGGNLPLNLKHATSAESPYYPGDTNRVVGYLSGALLKSKNPFIELPNFSEEEQDLLKQIAQNSVRSKILRIKDSLPFKIENKNLNLNLPAFVTIRKKGALRACMGHTSTELPLYEEISHSAQVASTEDSRFGPIKKNELADLDFEITVLSRMKRVVELSQIQIARDGLYIRLGSYGGLFLPQVPVEQKWNLTEYLENLCYKAGLQKNDYLNPKAQLFSFRAFVID
ncbi:MAG: AmmeMemoRadiSam system protein B [Ignavibacteria bacterium]|nr:AmmeMemoRadiSam system protein B [Ignavibacteria bacterium]